MGTEALRKRRPIWKLVLSFLGILAGILIAFLIWLARLSERRWRDMELRVQEMKAEYQARIAPRPVLRGVATPGNAWDDYLPAINKLKGIGRGTTTLADYVSRNKNADRAAVESLLSKHGVLLDQLRKGASRATGQFPWNWESAGNRYLDVFAAQAFANLAVSQARFLHESGKHRAAAELLLDAAQLGRDTGDNSALTYLKFGFNIQASAFEELRDLLSTKSVLAEDTATIVQGLEILDRTFPRLSSTLLWTGLYEGTSNLSDSADGWTGAPRLMTIHAFFEYDRRMREAGESEAQSWSNSQRIAQRLDSEAQTSWNPVFNNTTFTFLVNSLEEARERHAQLRLLRMLAEFRSGGEVPELEDPFGTKLLHAESGGKLRFWSVGPDGVDDGGGKRDIVLEIER